MNCVFIYTIGLIGDGRVLSRFDFINTTFLCQDSAIQLTNNAGCSQFNSTSCASGRSTRIECYNSKPYTHKHSPC